jgi:hypothetical protein
MDGFPGFALMADATKAYPEGVSGVCLMILASRVGRRLPVALNICFLAALSARTSCSKGVVSGQMRTVRCQASAIGLGMATPHLRLRYWSIFAFYAAAH